MANAPGDLQPPPGTVKGGGANERDKEAAIAEVRAIFERLKRVLKQIALYRHMKERYSEYLEPVYLALVDFLKRHGTLSLKVEALGFKYESALVFEDDNRENNMVYPFWQMGVRLFMFKKGLSQEELLRFLMLPLRDDSAAVAELDILTQLWRADFRHIEYIVIENFQVLPDEDAEEVEIEVDKVVAYLYRQLQSNSEDYMRFARVTVDDFDLELNNVDQVRGLVVQGVTASSADVSKAQTMIHHEQQVVFQKMVLILFQVLEIGTTQENFEDISQAFVQLLDVLIFKEDYATIVSLTEQFDLAPRKSYLDEAQKEQIAACGQMFKTKMAETQRLQMLGQYLNARIPEDAESIQAYLVCLGETAIDRIMAMLEGVELPENRSLLTEVLAKVGENKVDTFAQHFSDPESTLIKDMLEVVDRIDPPNKFELFAKVLSHPSPVLRMEVLQTIGRNPSKECFEYIKKTVTHSEDLQLRNVAIRALPNYDKEMALPMILDMIQDIKLLMKKELPERKAIFAAVGKIKAKETNAFLKQVLTTKRGLLAQKGVEEMKELAIEAFEHAPSMAGLQLLAQVAQDKKKQSTEIRVKANRAALIVKSKLLGK